MTASELIDEAVSSYDQGYERAAHAYLAEAAQLVSPARIAELLLRMGREWITTFKYADYLRGKARRRFNTPVGLTA